MSSKIECNIKNEIVSRENKLPALGIRHLQIMMMFLVVTVLYVIRSSMAVAVLAMTDLKRYNLTGASKHHTNGTDIINGTVADAIAALGAKGIDVFDWDERIRGCILSAFFWGYTLNQVPGGVLAKRFGGKAVLLGSLLLNSLLCFVMPYLAKVGGWQTVFFIRLLMGLSQCLLPCCHTLLGKWVPPHERTRLSNIVYTGIQIGTIVSMPLGGLLARTALGWKLIFYSMGGLALAMAALWAALAASSPADHRLISHEERTLIERSLSSKDNQTTAAIPWRRLLTSVPLLALCTTHVGTTWAFTIFFVEIPTYMNNVLGINLKNSGILSALPFAAMWIMSIVNSVVCEYLSNKKILSNTTCRKLFNSIGSFGPAAGLVVLAYVSSEHPYVAVAVLTLTVGLQSGVTSGMMLNHLDLSPTYAGVMLGMTNGMGSIVASFVPIVTGYILGDSVMDLSRWRLVFFQAALVVVATNLVFLIWGTAVRQSWDDPAYKGHKPELEILKASSLETEKVYMFEQKNEEK